jgi:hypothetical protein
MTDTFLLRAVALCAAWKVLVRWFPELRGFCRFSFLGSSDTTTRHVQRASGSVARWMRDADFASGSFPRKVDDLEIAAGSELGIERAAKSATAGRFVMGARSNCPSRVRFEVVGRS